MIVPSETRNDPGIFDALGQALQVYVQHFPVLATLSFPAIVLPVVRILIEDSTNPVFSMLWLILWPLSFCIQMVFFIALVLSVPRCVLGEPVDVGQSLQEGVLRLWKYSVAVGLFLLILTAGAVLLVVPFFYWLTIFGLFYLFVLLEDRRTWEAFQASEDLVRGRFWKMFRIHLTVLGMALGMILPFAIGLALMGVDGTFRMITGKVLEAFLVPFFVIFYYLFFCWFKNSRVGPGSIAVYEKT